MVVLQNILLKKKTNPYLKYFLNHKILFCLSDFAKHFRKASYSTKESYGSESNFNMLCDNSDDLKIIFSFSIF